MTCGARDIVSNLLGMEKSEGASYTHSYNAKWPTLRELDHKARRPWEMLHLRGKDELRELANAREEIERLKKQLAMSDADITTAKVLFAAWQEAYRKLAEAVDALPPETGGKLRAAMQAQAKAWAGEDA